MILKPICIWLQSCMVLVAVGEFLSSHATKHKRILSKWFFISNCGFQWKRKGDSNAILWSVSDRKSENRQVTMFPSGGILLRSGCGFLTSSPLTWTLTWIGPCRQISWTCRGTWSGTWSECEIFAPSWGSTLIWTESETCHGHRRRRHHPPCPLQRSLSFCPQAPHHPACQEHTWNLLCKQKLQVDEYWFLQKDRTYSMSPRDPNSATPSPLRL